MADNTVRLDGWECSDGPVPVVDAQGCTWVWSTIEGWWGGTDVRANPVAPLDGSDGDLDGHASTAARRVSIAGTVLAPGGAELQAALDRLASILAGNRRGPLVVDEGIRGVARRALVRLGGPTLVSRTGPRSADFSLSLYASDSARYSDALHSVSTSRFVGGSGGRPSPYDEPYTYAGSGGSDGLVTVSNAGTAPTWPTFRIVGPVTNPAITLVGGPNVTVLADIPAGTEMVIDAREQSVMVGPSSRSAFLSFTTEFFALPVGESQLMFEATAGSGLLTVEWRDAWP